MNLLFLPLSFYEVSPHTPHPHCGRCFVCVSSFSFYVSFSSSYFSYVSSYLPRWTLHCHHCLHMKTVSLPEVKELEGRRVIRLCHLDRIKQLVQDFIRTLNRFTVFQGIFNRRHASLKQW